jgi:hypothetical protein
MQTIEIPIPSSDPAIQELIAQTNRLLEAARAPATRKAYASDWRHMSPIGCFRFWERHMDVETFLAALAASRRAEQARHLPARALPADFRLRRELEIAIQYRWFLQPVLADSIYAGNSARVGVPDNTRANRVLGRHIPGLQLGTDHWA